MTDRKVAAGSTGDLSRQSGRYQIRSVMRALDILVNLSDGPRRHDLSSLARRSGLHPTTALRHLESLRARGFVRQLPNGNYELGVRLFELGNAFARSMSIWTHANELAQDLAELANETASVGVLDAGEVLYIAIAHGQRELGIQSSPGTRHPAHCTALGKAMLAAMPWTRAQSVLGGRPLVRKTAKTIVSLDALRQELVRTAKRGYSVDDEERLEGVFCIGAPIRDHSGSVVAAVSVSGPKIRVNRKGLQPLARIVIESSEEASRRLGAPVA